jgi:hypothetical protein
MQQNSFIANLMSAQRVMLCVWAAWCCNITQPGHITYSPAPDQRPANQKYIRLILWLTLLRYHVAHTRLPLNLPPGYLPTDTRLSTLFIRNLTLPPVMPTHYSHDVHHSLCIPIRRTLLTITKRHHTPCYNFIFSIFTVLCTTRRNHLYNLELLMMGITVPETCWADIKFAIKLFCCI